MICFDGYIGVGSHCTTGISESGKYLTDLPGVTLQNIDSVADESQLSFLGVFADVEKRAISRISKDVLSFMKSKYDLKKSIQTYTITGELGDSVSSLNTHLGLNLYTSTFYSELLQFHVSKVYLYASSIEDTTVKVYAENVELYSQTITTEIGWNEIYVNRSFRESEINIVYDSSVFTHVNHYDLESCNCVCDAFDGLNIVVRGVSKNGNAYSFSNDSYGLKADISLRCLHDSIICANIDIYADAYLYALGVELMRERLYSDRINRFTTVDRKRAQELLDLFTQDYADFLDTANNTVQLNNDSCIECIESSGSKWVMP